MTWYRNNPYRSEVSVRLHKESVVSRVLVTEWFPDRMDRVRFYNVFGNLFGIGTGLGSPGSLTSQLICQELIRADRFESSEEVPDGRTHLGSLDRFVEAEPPRYLGPTERFLCAIGLATVVSFFLRFLLWLWDLIP